ncbi:hypothetical protein CBL_05647 [Carabus blaptoides fortunei]
MAIKNSSPYNKCCQSNGSFWQQLGYAGDRTHDSCATPFIYRSRTPSRWTIIAWIGVVTVSCLGFILITTLSSNSDAQKATLGWSFHAAISCSRPGNYLQPGLEGRQAERRNSALCQCHEQWDAMGEQKCESKYDVDWGENGIISRGALQLKD